MLIMHFIEITVPKILSFQNVNTGKETYASFCAHISMQTSHISSGQEPPGVLEGKLLVAAVYLQEGTWG